MYEICSKVKGYFAAKQLDFTTVNNRYKLIVCLQMKSDFHVSLCYMPAVIFLNAASSSVYINMYYLYFFRKNTPTKLALYRVCRESV